MYTTVRLRLNVASRHLFRHQLPKLGRSLSLDKHYDVVVIGGGHAGSEASAAAARMGVKTLLVTHKKETVGEMSCNPSFGGIGKGHLMREIDALDGVCSKICDKSGVQYKLLNRSKGPAVWGYRAQIDRKLYKQHIQEFLFNLPNLEVLEGSVENLIIENHRKTKHDNTIVDCCGIILKDGTKIHSKTVVITTGTFLNGQINIGMEIRPAGRLGDEPAIALADTLRSLGLRMDKLRTGTPPRLKVDSINFNICEETSGDNPPLPFSFMNERVWLEPDMQLKCYITHTRPGSLKKIIKDNLYQNRHVAEEITGPRYCPSIESKVLKFGDDRSHHVWLEPEGFDSDVIYPNGLTCTLPEALQVELVRTVPGLEKAELVRPGYGVYYEYVDPRELERSLHLKRIRNCFLAGQINGTTGYEEAAAQGIIAGINAAALTHDKEPLLLSRTESYIGVMIDDLVTLGTTEPYRMFTSRAEFRLTLRPDNADIRLTHKGYAIGCVSQERQDRTIQVAKKYEEGMNLLNDVSNTVTKWRALMGLPHSTSTEKKTAFEMMKGTDIVGDGISLELLSKAEPHLDQLLKDSRIAQRLKIEAIYEFATTLQANYLEEVRINESYVIPRDIDYGTETISMSHEEREKLRILQPQTIAAASRIPGVSTSTLLRLLRYIKKVKKREINYI